MEMDQTYECFGSGAELGQDGYITSMNFLSDPGHPLPAISDRTALQVVPSSDSLTFTGTPYSGYIPAPNSAECEESHRTEVMSLPPPLPSFDDTVQFQMLYGMDSNPGLDGPSYTNYFGDGYPRYVVAGGGYCCNNGSSCGYFVKAEERSNAGNKCDDSKTYGGTYTETKTNSSHQPPLHGYGNEEKESEYEEEEDYEEDEEEEDDGDSGNNGSKLVDETKSKKKTKAVPNDLSSHEKKIRVTDMHYTRELNCVLSCICYAFLFCCCCCWYCVDNNRVPGATTTYKTPESEAHHSASVEMVS